jgi:hypothetical protein
MINFLLFALMLVIIVIAVIMATFSPNSALVLLCVIGVFRLYLRR